MIDTLAQPLACADEDSSMNAIQLERFRAVASTVPARRYKYIANSAGICLGRDYSLDLVRPGISLYGGGSARPKLFAMSARSRGSRRRSIPTAERIPAGRT